MKTDDDEQSETRQEDVHEDAGEEKRGSTIRVTAAKKKPGRIKSRKTHVSPSKPSSFSVMVTVWLKTASWKMFP